MAFIDIDRAEIIVPPPARDADGKITPWPTLGPQLIEFFESHFVYGPGTLKGKPYVVRREFRYLLMRLYEHYPEGTVFDDDGEITDMSGRRAYDRAAISLPKGSAKCLDPETELILESGARVKAKDLKAGDSVQSYKDGEVVYRRVLAVEEQPEAMTYRVETDHGRSITVSEGHPFLVSGTRWVFVENLKAGHRLTSVHDEIVGVDAVSSVTPVGLAKTIGVEVEDTHVHVTNGLVTHNTEFMALICLAELHPDAPVRFNGYDPKAPGGLAPGRPVTSPYIPLLAPTKEQLDDLAFGVASEVALMMDDSDLFDVNKERIMRVGEADSKIVPIANNPGAADGKRPTFQGIDEPHRLTQDRQIQTYTTMVQNLPKRYADDPWQLSVTTAGDPSEDSIARRDFLHGMRIYRGEIEQPRMFFYHRGTTDENAKFDTMGQRMRALKEASGEEASKFRDLRTVALQWDEESSDKAYLERVWCNRWIKSAKSAFDVKAFNALGHPELVIEPGSRVTLGFDGSVNQDSTALVMTEISTGIQNIIGLWERPENVKEWSVPVGEVDEAVDFCFDNFEVILMHADPPYWQSYLSKWEGKYGNRVREWPTRTTIKMYYAIRAYEEAIASGALGHNDDERFKRHIASAGKNMLGRFDDEGKEMYRLAKVSEGRKYDAAMAAILSWDARSAALAMGETSTPETFEPWRIR